MNPNAYQDKITDQKFFNRNFKLKSTDTSKDNTTNTNTTTTTTNNGITSSATSNNSMNTVDLIERNYTSLGMCEFF